MDFEENLLSFKKKLLRGCTYLLPIMWNISSDLTTSKRHNLIYLSLFSIYLKSLSSGTMFMILFFLAWDILFMLPQLFIHEHFSKRLEKKLDGNYTRMLRAILNKSWRQHPTRHQLYGHLPPITKTIQVRRTRPARHCWRSRDELIRDVLLWTPTHGRAKAGQQARTYIQQLCENTGCCPEDLPRAMNDREE